MKIKVHIEKVGTWKCEKCGRLMTRFPNEGKFFGDGSQLDAAHFEAIDGDGREIANGHQICQGTLRIES